MILRYTPDGQPPQVFDLSQIKFLTSEAETAERTTDRDWATLKSRDALAIKGSPTAKRIILWLLLKRATPTLRLKDFDPAEEDITVKLDAAEGAEILEEALAVVETEAQEDQARRELDSILDQDVPRPFTGAPAPAPAVPEDGPVPESVPPPDAVAAPAAADPWVHSAPTASPSAG